MTTMYGIPNCDTIKKAKKWLGANDIPFQFHDFRKDGIDIGWLEQAADELGWENLMNKRGTTYRQLPEEQKADLNSTKALALLRENPAMIKRPVLEHNGSLHLGFKPGQYEDIFS